MIISYSTFFLKQKKFWFIVRHLLADIFRFPAFCRRTTWVYCWRYWKHGPLLCRESMDPPDQAWWKLYIHFSYDVLFFFWPWNYKILSTLMLLTFLVTKCSGFLFVNALSDNSLFLVVRFFLWVFFCIWFFPILNKCLFYMCVCVLI